MNQSYQKYLLIALSVISVSLAGMEQRSQLNQSDNSTWVIQPVGGYLQDYQGRKKIHFAPVNNNTDINNPIYQFLKYGSRPAISLNIFTEEGYSQTIHYKNNNGEKQSFTIISDKLYNEKDFVTYHEHCRKKYSEYDSKIHNINS